MELKWAGWSLGTFVALLVLIAVFVMALVGHMPAVLALILGALAFARLC